MEKSNMAFRNTNEQNENDSMRQEEEKKEQSVYSLTMSLIQMPLKTNSLTGQIQSEKECETREATFQTTKVHQEQFQEEEQCHEDYQNNPNFQEVFPSHSQGQITSIKKEVANPTDQIFKPQNSVPTQDSIIMQAPNQKLKVDSSANSNTNYENVSILDMLNRIKCSNEDINTPDLILFVSQLESFLKKKSESYELNNIAQIFQKKCEECYFVMLNEFFLQSRRRVYSRAESSLKLFEFLHQLYVKSTQDREKAKKEIDELNELIKVVKLYLALSGQ